MSAKKFAKRAAKPAAGKETQKTLKEILNVKGMHCKSCVNKIEDGVSSIKGVSKVSVSLKDDKATVEYDSSEVSIDEIKKEIRSLGFKVDGKGQVNSKKDTTLMQGIGYALMPHIGCIAFIAGSILGVTVLTELFRPLLMNRWFFHILIAISIGFATLSSALYLRKQGLLSASGARKKWQYLSTMYGSTIGINLILFLLVFPMLANIPAAQATGAAITGVQGAAAAAASSAAPAGGYSVISMSVDIPCPGHAPLITGELKTLSGVHSVVFSFPNVFDVTYDPAKTTKADMLALDVFKEYPTTVLSERKAGADTLKETTANNQSVSATSGSCHSGGAATGTAAPAGGTCGGSTGGGCSCGGVR
ncbi:MAG: cation transporter [Candidatus Aenigmatarchaeota archaeon]